MAGGGKIQQSEPNQDIAATPVPYLQNAKAATIPAFMPGQQQQLAAQLGAGFAASPASFANYLNQIYSPARTLTFMPGLLKPTKPTAGGGKKPVVNGRVTPVRRTTFGANSR